MTRSEKVTVVELLKEKFSEYSFFYLTDFTHLTVEDINKLRGMCFEKDVEMLVAKNSLIAKAFEALGDDKGYGDLAPGLKGPTAIMFSKTGNIPAKLIKEFRGKDEKPVLKAAYIDSDVFIGDENVDMLATLKSKDELIGEVIGLLQSPAKNVISALKSGGSTIMGLLKTLEER